MYHILSKLRILINGLCFWRQRIKQFLERILFSFFGKKMYKIRFSFKIPDIRFLMNIGIQIVKSLTKMAQTT